jgi:hypothetical protein
MTRGIRHLNIPPFEIHIQSQLRVSGGDEGNNKTRLESIPQARQLFGMSVTF